MKTITTQTIKHIAELSRLLFTKEEEEQMQKHLSDFLDVMQSLDSVETDQNRQPLVVNALRSDDVIETSDDNYVSLAPLKKDGFYIVPRVTE